MKNQRKKCLIVITSLLVLVTVVGINYLNYRKTNNVLLEKAKLQEKEIKRKTFALMLEQNDGTYLESNDTTWPTSGYTFNSTKSQCKDNNGNIVENALTFSNGATTIKSSKTLYCYLYFDKLKITADNLITLASLWNSGLENDGYRYIGINPDNYICFGTSDKSTCTGNTDAYMYRIIGIFQDSTGANHLKLIKKEALNETIAWYTDNTTDVPWEESTIYSAINGSTYLANTKYMPSTTWSNKITTWTWRAINTLTDENYGPEYNYTSPRGIYQNEMLLKEDSTVMCYSRAYGSYTGPGFGGAGTCAVGELTTPSAKVGLMYVSDYVLSLGSPSLETSSILRDLGESFFSQSWMYLSVNDADSANKIEYSISRFGQYSRSTTTPDDFGIYIITPNYPQNNYQTSSYLARPVFYLNSDVVISSGTGTASDPYVIS